MSNNSERRATTVARHTFGSWMAQSRWKAPLQIVDAEGAYFYDGNSKRYLDFSSQLMCSNLGHKNRALIDSMKEQAERLPYLNPAFTCSVKEEATEALLGVMPRGIEVFFYSTSGTEANEAAVKIAGSYLGQSQKYKIISRYHSYHGSTAGSIALTGDVRRWYAEPLGKIQGTLFAPDAYCYRCPFKLQHPDCGIICAEYLDHMIRMEGNVAAVILEPVVGTNGVIVPPKEYLPRVRQITEEHEVLLIADEVMSGWFRTGKWFAVNNWDVVPDILTTAKGATGAYMPLGITATSRKIQEYFEDHYFPHGHTYAAHPMTLSPVKPAVKEYERLERSGHIRAVSRYLERRLRELSEDHVSIGDVRGLGMFWGIEIVRDRRSKEPFNTRADKFAMKQLMVDRIASECMVRGVYVSGWVSHLVVAPPLVITEGQIDEGVNAIGEALTLADKEVG